MSLSYRLAVCFCLAGLATWVAIACSAPNQMSMDNPVHTSVRLFTRTPTPTVTPTPTIPPQVFYQDGVAQRNAWRLQEALDYFNTALSVSPSAPYYTSRAEVNRLMGNYEAASADIRRALAMDSELPEAWLQKAVLEYALGAWEEALIAINRFIEMEPENAAAYALRAQIYAQELGEPEEALFDYQRAIRRDPSFEQTTLVERWHILAGLGRWPEALLISHHLMQDSEDAPLDYYYRAWPLIKMGWLDEAIQTLFVGVERFPREQLALYYALGVAYYERRAWSEAIQTLNVALLQSDDQNLRHRLEISTADILGRLGVAYLKLKQCETGAAIVARAIDESQAERDWQWARQSVEQCYLSITPTPTPTEAPTP